MSKFLFSDRQVTANCGPTVTINQRLQYVRKLTADFIIN
jgi:hypothetical protein